VQFVDHPDQQLVARPVNMTGRLGSGDGRGLRWREAGALREGRHVTPHSYSAPQRAHDRGDHDLALVAWQRACDQAGMRPTRSCARQPPILRASTRKQRQDVGGARWRHFFQPLSASKRIERRLQRRDARRG